jgi:ketosteroid isomerase-like protein
MKKSATWLVVALACLAGAGAQEPVSADKVSIQQILARYAEAVNGADVNILDGIWSHSPDVSFIYPLGEEHGLKAIEQNVFVKVMGGMFSARDLKIGTPAIHVHGDSAYSEFHWEFHAKRRDTGAAVTTRGVETQIYERENGTWRIVHVHYSGEQASDLR